MNIIQDITNQFPLVSICCLAYNQEKYISQALESLLMQRTSFPYEIIVHDDASTDNTRKIIEEYASNFPDIIKPILQERNKHSLSGFNFLYEEVFPKAVGKYIAFCDGDDYWIDALKLQKQVDFLEVNSDFGMVHSKTIIYNEAKKEFEGFHGFEVDNFESLVTENTIAQLTTCLRNDLFRGYLNDVSPQKHVEWTAEDFPIWLWVIQHTKIKFMEDVTSVYRFREGSISHINDDIKRLNFSKGIYNIVNYFLNKYPGVKSERKIRARYYSKMIKMFFLDKRWGSINKSVKIFYDANDWLNLLWITVTLPFSFSKFLVKGSYWFRARVFNIFKVYPIKQQE